MPIIFFFRCLSRSPVLVESNGTCRLWKGLDDWSTIYNKVHFGYVTTTQAPTYLMTSLGRLVVKAHVAKAFIYPITNRINQWSRSILRTHRSFRGVSELCHNNVTESAR
jgi:hypothetical protein